MDIALSVALIRACGHSGRCRLPLSCSPSGTIKGLVHSFRETIDSLAQLIVNFTEPQNSRSRTMAMDALTSVAIVVPAAFLDLETRS